VSIRVRSEEAEPTSFSESGGGGWPSAKGYSLTSSRLAQTCRCESMVRGVTIAEIVEKEEEANVISAGNVRQKLVVLVKRVRFIWDFCA
jgi:hypothetical protein